MKSDASIRNLIFDLGGVILDLSVDHTLQAFSDLSGIEKKKVSDLYVSSPGFEAYEKGLMTDESFRDFVREVYTIQSSAALIDASWVAMLRGIPLKRLQLLRKLKKSYSIYLLSNTNSIHLNYINQIMLPPIDQENSLDVYFHHAYYSHIMKKRKPDADIFEQVLDENSLSPDQTLFLDDNIGNIEGAKQLGIKTLHVVTPDLIFDYFHEQ